MSKTKLTLAVLILILAALSCTSSLPAGNDPAGPGFADCVPTGTRQEKAVVLQVIDGDTIEVRIDGRVERVRYVGVDTPERDDPYYQEARLANQLLLGEGEILLVQDVSERDRYDRLLRYVFSAEGVFVNYELMRGGYAQIITYPPDVSCAETFLAAQESARGSQSGIWALPHFTLQEGSSVVIGSVHYNGSGHPVETDEYAEVRNTGSEPVEITGWTLNAGAHSQDFVFPNFVLDPGQACRVYTNEIHAESCGFSFAMDESIWSNSGDCGYLYDPAGALMDEFCYSN